MEKGWSIVYYYQLNNYKDNSVFEQVLLRHYKHFNGAAITILNSSKKLDLYCVKLFNII